MNTFEKTIQESLKTIQSSPSAGLKYRVMRSIDNEGEVNAPVFWRRIPVRAALIAALIGVVALTTAFTFGDRIISVVQQLIFGNSVAKQVELAEGYGKGSIGVMNRSSLIEDAIYPLGSFETLEEAREVAPFPIRVPTFLPDNVTGLNSVGVYRSEEPDGPDMHFVIVSYNITLNGGGNAILQLRQFYAGPDAYFDLETVSEIEKVMVGNSEAVLISASAKDWVDTEDISYTLYWLNDGIAYELGAEYHDGYSPETMIKIAESVR